MRATTCAAAIGAEGAEFALNAGCRGCRKAAVTGRCNIFRAKDDGWTRGGAATSVGWFEPRRRHVRRERVHLELLGKARLELLVAEGAVPVFVERLEHMTHAARRHPMVGDAEFGHALSLLDDAEIGQRCRSHFCHASCFHDDCGDPRLTRPRKFGQGVKRRKGSPGLSGRTPA